MINPLTKDLTEDQKMKAAMELYEEFMFGCPNRRLRDFEYWLLMREDGKVSWKMEEVDGNSRFVWYFE